jgi:hypothetical protein
LLAAAEETGLIKVLNEAVADSPVPRLVKSQSSTRQSQMLTLLFMNVCQVSRPWDLRFYSGDGLALLSGRKRAYGYAHTERFLSQVAQGEAVERLTDSLASWSSRLWGTQEVLYCYVDGHKKPVYSDSLLPRSLVGRLDKILGCRALTLLMDGAGHPLLVETARGDQHLTIGAPSIMARYERVVGTGKVATLIIDREGMSANFLNAMREQRNVITLLRSNQYTGLDSFSHVGEFVPLLLDRDGQVIREVAPAQFPLALPEQPGVTLQLCVALIRDWSKQVPVEPCTDQEPRRWDDDLDKGERWRWLQGQFEATPAPSSPTQPKLIPIISTSHELSILELAATYRQRWTAQENIIRDFLLPLGLDTNYGYAKRQVENSEVAKVRTTLQKRLEKARARTENAYRQADWNSKRYHKLWDQTKQYSAQQYQRLHDDAQALAAQAVPDAVCEQVRQTEQQAIDSHLKARWQQVDHAIERSNAAFDRYQQASIAQRQALRDLQTLDEQARTMFELDNTKDHLMSVLKLMLVNLLMWTRDHLFPPTYAHATTKTLLPFFRLPGRVLTFDDRVLVSLRPFNDRALNRDLAQFCLRVNDAHLCLPAGKALIFRVAESAHPTSYFPP